MKKRTRYLLIALCIAIFAILAPAIVFFIRGIRPGLGVEQAEQTGILVVTTQPKRAKVYLDDTLADTTPATLRFLSPRNYAVTLRAEGYFDWSKRLDVKAGKVMWATNGTDDIYLIKNDILPKIMATGATDFAIHGSTALYLTRNTLVRIAVGNPEKTENFTLPKAVSRISNLAGSNYFILTGNAATLLFSDDTKTFTDLSGIVAPGSPLHMSADGTLLSIDRRSLVSIDLKTKKTNVLIPGVTAFATANRDLYYIQGSGDEAVLRTVPLSGVATTAGTTVFSGMPAAQDTRLIVTPQREIAVLADGALYRINGNLERIADGITSWAFNEADDILSFTAAGELRSYSFAADGTRFVTRATTDIVNPIISTRIGYAFYIQKNQLHALELDSRDHQNDYVLFSGNAVTSLTSDTLMSVLYFREGDKLTSIKIR